MTSIEAAAPARAGVLKGELMALAAIAFALLLILDWRYIGFQGSDDHSYSLAADAWLEDFPALGTTHWSLRYPIVFPIAASYLAFGKSVFALSLTNLLYFAGFLVVLYLTTRRVFGWPAAATGTAILISLPGYSIAATYVNSDLAELFYVICSACLYAKARAEGAPAWLLIAAGVMAGLAFLVRETSLALVLAYGLLFLFAPGMARSRYLLLAAGAALIVGIQFAYLTEQTGDPLYRLKVSASHDAVDRAAERDRVSANREVVDSEGVLSVSPYLDPILVLFVSQKFGLLFYAGLAGAAYAGWRWRALPPRQREMLLVLGTLGLTWYLFVTFASAALYIVPRYYLVPGAAAAVVAGPALLAGLRSQRALLRIGSACALTGMAAASLLALYLENTEPLYLEKALVELAAESDELVYVNRRTGRRALFLLTERGIADRVSSEPPPAGALVFHRYGLLEGCERSKYCRVTEALRAYAVAPDWRELERHDPPKRLLGRLLRTAGLAPFVPHKIMRKIEQPYPGYAIYRLPGEPSVTAP